MPAVEVLIAAVVLMAAMVFEVVMSPVVNMMVAIVALAVTIHWTARLGEPTFY